MNCVCVSSEFEREDLFPKRSVGHLLPCYLNVPYHHRGLSIEINSSVTSAIVSHTVPLIFGHSQAVALIEFYGTIMAQLWKAGMLFNMQTLIEKPLLSK